MYGVNVIIWFCDMNDQVCDEKEKREHRLLWIIRDQL